ncbi:MAG: hypothetical protein AAF270_10045 [Pseudomonadota bacterium]
MTPDYPDDANVTLSPVALLAAQQRLDALPVQPARWLELLDVLAAERRAAAAPGLLGISALLLAILGAMYVPYPWTYWFSVPTGVAACWWLAVSYAHLRNKEKLRLRARKAQAELEQADGFLWRFAPLIARAQGRVSSDRFVTLQPCARASRRGTLSADIASLRDYWYWIVVTGVALAEFEVALTRSSS